MLTSLSSHHIAVLAILYNFNGHCPKPYAYCAGPHGAYKQGTKAAL